MSNLLEFYAKQNDLDLSKGGSFVLESFLNRAIYNLGYQTEKLFDENGTPTPIANKIINTVQYNNNGTFSYSCDSTLGMSKLPDGFAPGKIVCSLTKTEKGFEEHENNASPYCIMQKNPEGTLSSFYLPEDKIASDISKTTKVYDENGIQRSTKIDSYKNITYPKTMVSSTITTPAQETISMERSNGVDVNVTRTYADANKSADVYTSTMLGEHTDLRVISDNFSSLDPAQAKTLDYNDPTLAYQESTTKTVEDNFKATDPEVVKLLTPELQQSLQTVANQVNPQQE